MFEKTRFLYPIRQGIVRKLEDSRLFALLGNNNMLEVSDFQGFIWERANGRNSLSDIFDMSSVLVSEATSDFKSDFVENIAFLAKAALIYLR